ncbi:tyrosine-type recombinase/integrase [Nocardia carnea]|uniref:tyrosine-type recombinase/integrase n=1 Tax=Nocardia carnea TaxID=37328 RepID=UPI00031D09BE|nr:tyrosine-type recombinase/integrase [Nocardia carnea]
MTELGQVSTPAEHAVSGADSGVRRTGTGTALRAVTAEERAAEDLLNAGHRALLDALLADGTAANTTRTYHSPVARFREWCTEHGYRELPAEPETVAAFLAEAEALRDERDEDLYRYPTSTLGMWAAAIRHAHLDAGHPDPTTAPVVRKALVSIDAHRTEAGQEAQRASPLLAADVSTLVDCITAHAADNDWKAQVAACRDIALIVCGFYSGRRRSEIAAIQFRDLTVVADEDDPDQKWIRMRIRGSKTSRTTIEYVHLPRSNDPRYCPWCTLLDWLDLLAVHDTAIAAAVRRKESVDNQIRASRKAVIELLAQFEQGDPGVHHCQRELPTQQRTKAAVWRGVAKATRNLPADTGRPITDQTIKDVLKRRCEQAGFAPERIALIAGHSLRGGFVTQLRRDGVPVADIMRQTGHKRVETVLRYDQNPGYRNNAANRIPL